MTHSADSGRVICRACELDEPCHTDPQVSGCMCRLDSHYVDCSYLGYDLSHNEQIRDT